MARAIRRSKKAVRKSPKATGGAKPVARGGTAGGKPKTKGAGHAVAGSTKKAAPKKGTGTAKRSHAKRGEPQRAAPSLRVQVKRAVGKAVDDGETAMIRAGQQTAETTKRAATSTAKAVASTGRKVLAVGRVVLETAAGVATGAATGTVKAVKHAVHDASSPPPAKRRPAAPRKRTMGEKLKTVAEHAVAGAAVGAVTGAMKVAIPELETAAGIRREDGEEQD